MPTSGLPHLCFLPSQGDWGALHQARLMQTFLKSKGEVSGFSEGSRDIYGKEAQNKSNPAFLSRNPRVPSSI